MYTNISSLNRVLRIVLSLGLVFTVLSMSGPLGALVSLPFVSIYAGITGFIGWDPVIALMSDVHQKLTAKPTHIHHGGGLAAH